MMKNKAIQTLRAISILMIILFHMNGVLFSGGFIGVDLFLVLGAYLLTSKLLDKAKKGERLNITYSMRKKFTQTAPQVYAMVFVTIVFLALFNGPLLKNSYKDGLASLLFVDNIWQIINKVGYFEAGEFLSPFKHLWYMGIYMQLFICLLLIFALVYLLSKKDYIKTKKTLFMVCASLLFLSFIKQWILYDPENVNRIYYGLDTRFFEFMVGALGAILFPLSGLDKSPLGEYKDKAWMVCTIGLILFIIGTFKIDYSQEFLYKGGFFLLALISLAIILSAALSTGIAKRILNLPGLSFIGDISFSLYIWHFPVIALTMDKLEILDPKPIPSILRIIAAFIIAIVARELFERGHVLNKVKKTLSRATDFINKQVKWVKISLYVLLVLPLVIFILGSTGHAVPGLSTLFISKTDKKIESTVIKSDAKEELEAKPETESKSEPKTSEAEAKTDENKILPYKKLIVFGDSTSVELGKSLANDHKNVILDGKVGRQLYNSYTDLEKYRVYDSADNAIIFSLGSNGNFRQDHLDKLLSYFAKSDIYFINVKAPVAWMDAVNKRLAENAAKNPKIKLIDWNKASEGHDEYFYNDATHANPTGVNALKKLVIKTLARPIE